MTDAMSSGHYGDFSGLAVAGCRGMSVWTDTRGGMKIFGAQLGTGGGAGPPDLGNTLRGVADGARDPALSWTDLGGDESDYRVYRSLAKDPDTVPPNVIGTSGGPDLVAFTDGGSSAAPAVWFYHVRAIDACGVERTTW